MRIVIVSLATPCIAILWQYIGKKYGTTVLPSVFLTSLSTRLQNVWSWVGKAFAYVSSYLTYINLTELWQAVHEVFNPLFGIFSSPAQFVIGYCKYINEHVAKNMTYLIPIGSVMLVLLVLYFSNKYNLHRRLGLVKLFTWLYTKTGDKFMCDTARSWLCEMTEAQQLESQGNSYILNSDNSYIRPLPDLQINR